MAENDVMVLFSYSGATTQGMQELELLVEKLSSSELPLEEAIAVYEQGTQLHAQLEEMLKLYGKK